jgi:hypothetical protein
MVNKKVFRDREEYRLDNGVLHRLDGPAVEFYNGDFQFWENGIFQGYQLNSITTKLDYSNISKSSKQNIILEWLRFQNLLPVKIKYIRFESKDINNIICGFDDSGGVLEIYFVKNQKEFLKCIQTSTGKKLIIVPSSNNFETDDSNYILVNEQYIFYHLSRIKNYDLFHFFESPLPSM